MYNFGYNTTYNASTTNGGQPLENAIVTFNGMTKDTDSNGQAIFYGVRAAQNIEYIVTLDGYKTVEGDVDVSGSTSVTVTMEAV